MKQTPEPPSRHVLGLPVIALAAVAGVAALAAAFFAASALFSSGDDEESRYVEAVAGSPANINPLFAYRSETDRDLAELVFAGLTRIGADGEVLPDLAETWEVEGTAFTFHLRQDARWHTGAPVTSADVLFTYDLLAEPDVQADPDQGPLWRQINCNAPNDFTVICRLPQPFAPFLAYASIGILPKHILEGAPAATLIDNPFNQAPIGAGPYRLIQIDTSRAILRAHEEYHRGAPSIPEIELRFFPDTSTATASVIRGDTDGTMLDSRAPQPDFDAVAGQSSIRTYTANRSVYTLLYLNNREPPLNQVEVRRAIALTINIDEITGEILGGRAVRSDTPIVPGTWAFDSNRENTARDTQQADLLLRSAGWSIEEGADVRSRSDTELRISIMTDQDPIRGAVAEAIAAQLAQVGIAATVVREQSTNLVRDFLIPRQYQAAIFSWDPGPDPDPYPAWHSSQISATGRNIAAYSSNAADTLMEDARRTIDLDDRQRLYFSFQQQFAEDVPSVILYFPVFTYFVSDRVDGIEVGTLFTPSSRFNNVHEWTLRPGSGIGR